MFAPSPVSALRLACLSGLVSTGLPTLDAALGGGLRRNWLTEIVGEAGSGKTQWAFTIASNHLQKKGAVYWLDTENTFRPERLLQILGGDEMALSRMLVRRCHSLSELLDSFSYLSSMVDAKDNDLCPLILVDSIAAVARVHASSAIDRTEVLHRLARIAKCTDAVTVVTNHVSAEIKSSNPCLRASLGNTWAHDVTCRFWINMQQHPVRQRNITVSKSPNLDNSVPFMLSITINSAGTQEAELN
jgi:DNA repair protein RadA